MHELSLVKSIIEIAEDEARIYENVKAEKIEIEIGALAGVEMDAFDFAWKEAVRNTILEDAKRVIIRTPAISQCEDCKIEFPFEEFYDPCPNCGQYNSSIIQGKELKVKSLVFDKIKSNSIHHHNL